MKFWQKIFIPVFILFFVCFNGGMSYCAWQIYTSALRTEEMAGYNSAIYVGAQISSCMPDYYDSSIERITSELERRIYQSVGTYYVSREFPFFIWDGEKVIYTNYKNESLELEWQNGMEGWKTYKVLGEKRIKDGEHEYFAFKTDFKVNDQQRYVVFLHSLDDFHKQWKNIFEVFACVEFVVTVILFVGLLIIVQHKTMSIVEMVAAANQIMEGDYTTKITVKGKDEIATLGKVFNQMTETVEGQIEDLKLVTEQKQRFIDNLGHELRTPLTTISGYAQYLMMAVVSEEEKYQYLSYMVGESHRLLKLSETLLELAVMKTDQLEKDWIRISEFEKQLRIAFASKMAEKSITMNFEIEVQTMYTNYELVYSLCSNLIENAYRSCNEEGHISFSMKNCDLQERKIEIVVKDDGIGIGEDDLRKISEPFYRVDKDRSRKKGGVGLGTTLCHRIVECLEGSITYQSEIGNGTTVIIIL